MNRPSAGFALLEIICVLAVIAMIAAFALPSMPRATSHARLQSLAMEAAVMLKDDRMNALQRRVVVSASVDAGARALHSGVSGRVLRFPDDTMVDALLPTVCQGRQVGSSIDFFPSGMSCGGVIALRRPGYAYEVRVNWFTGGVNVVPGQPL